MQFVLKLKEKTTRKQINQRYKTSLFNKNTFFLNQRLL